MSALAGFFRPGPDPALMAAISARPDMKIKISARPEREIEKSARARRGPKEKLKYRSGVGPINLFFFSISSLTA